MSDNDPTIPVDPAVPVNPSLNGKDGNTGKFTKNNKCGRGNPFIKEVNNLRRFLFQEIRKDDWESVKKALIKAAQSGDMKAMNLLLSYACGKPIQLIDINSTVTSVSPEEGKKRIAAFFGLDASVVVTTDPDGNGNVK